MKRISLKTERFTLNCKVENYTIKDPFVGSTLSLKQRLWERLANAAAGRLPHEKTEDGMNDNSKRT